MARAKKTGYDADMEYRLINIPPELWHRFRIQCVTEKKSIRVKILELIEQTLAKNKGKP